VKSHFLENNIVAAQVLKQITNGYQQVHAVEKNAVSKASVHG